MKKENLSPEEQEFLESYLRRSHHRFKEILTYSIILRKLTKD
ncbi:hypothetical protein ACVR1G_07625 [Streptococcus dentasini]